MINNTKGLREMWWKNLLIKVSGYEKVILDLNRLLLAEIEIYFKVYRKSKPQS